MQLPAKWAAIGLQIAGQMQPIWPLQLQPDLGQIVWQQPFFLSYLFFLSLVFDVHALCHEVAQCMHQARAIATKWQLHVHLGHASGPKGPLACPCAFASGPKGPLANAACAICLRQIAHAFAHAFCLRQNACATNACHLRWHAFGSHACICLRQMHACSQWACICHLRWQMHALGSQMHATFGGMHLLTSNKVSLFDVSMQVAL